MQSIDATTLRRMKFAPKLKTLMRMKGATQKQVASVLGIAQSGVGELASGKRMPSLEQVVTIAKYLGVTVAVLADDDYEPTDSAFRLMPPEEADLLRMVRDLGPALARRRLLGLPDDARPPSGSVVEAGRPLQQRDETALQLRLEREQREQRGGPTAGVPIPAKPVDKG